LSRPAGKSTDAVSDIGKGDVLAISGGVGGAKLALGLYRVLGADRLTVLANTGDDFEHLGLHISPDVDTLMYALAGVDNPRHGWGRAGETWTFMKALEELGGESWFRLGDADLATSVERTRLLRLGHSLSEVTEQFCARLGVRAKLMPMSNDPVRTLVETEQGTLAFQHYFVREGCAPRVTGFRFDGADAALANPGLIEILRSQHLRAVVICPSNPFISIDPILALPGARAALAGCSAPVVAVSPIIGGRAVKGPTDKMMQELGLAKTNVTIAEHYGDFLDGLVLDDTDAVGAEAVNMPTLSTRTVMNTLTDREDLAREVLGFAKCLTGG
jgi:LPPG:FO 2-phospho-L-lactate transferase